MMPSVGGRAGEGQRKGSSTSSSTTRVWAAVGVWRSQARLLPVPSSEPPPAPPPPTQPPCRSARLRTRPGAPWLRLGPDGCVGRPPGLCQRGTLLGGGGAGQVHQDREGGSKHPPTYPPSRPHPPTHPPTPTLLPGLPCRQILGRTSVRRQPRPSRIRKRRRPRRRRRRPSPLRR